MKNKLLILLLIFTTNFAFGQQISVQNNELKYRITSGVIKTAADKDIFQAKIDALSARIVSDSSALVTGLNTKLTKSSNLSDLTSSSTARSNLGLGNVNNTSDASKPISTATQSALDLKANIASPTFTGIVTSPALVLSSETANTIASFDASKNIKSLSLDTYPSLIEFSYVKGVTSAIQTQIGTKFNTPSGITSNNVPKWNGTAFTNSTISDNGTTVTIPTLSATNDALINSITLGRGPGNSNSNTIFGNSAFSSNLTGTNNVSIGISSLSLSTSSHNTAVGAYALQNQTSGASNTAIGRFSLNGNITGTYNVAIGRDAGRYIADGTTALTAIDNSIFIGGISKALSNNGTNQIAIGYNTTSLGDNTTRIGVSATTQTHLNGSLTIGSTTTLDASAIADFRSTTKGFLKPRMSTTQRNAITSPAAGLQIYNTNTNQDNIYNGAIWVTSLTSVNIVNVSTSALGTVSNTTVIIDNDVNLAGATVTLNNVTLRFAKGDKITNGTIIGTYTIEASDYDQIFDTTLSLGGTCRNSHLSVRWFGASGESLYAPDATYTFLYNDGVDDTPAINHTLVQAKNLGGGKVYLPGGTGSYWVRCQVPYASQAATNDHGDYYAIKIFDNTTLYGDGESSRIMVVDYMVAADYHATNPIYRTRGAIGFAPWTDEELTTEGIYTEINALNDIRFRKLGRNNVIVRDLNINCRVSKHPSSDVAFYSIIGVIYGVRLYSEDFEPNARGYDGNEVKNCYFYDVAVAALIKNFNYSSELTKVVKRTKVMFNNINKTSNKGIEISASNEAYVHGNTINDAETGIQTIMNSNYVTFSENNVKNSLDGINVTHGSSNVKVINNTVTDCDKPFIIRVDSPLIVSELISENILVSGNDFFQRVGTTDDFLFAFQGHRFQDSTASGYLRVRNVIFNNNNFKGNLAKIGSDDLTNQPLGYMAFAIENIKFFGNNWDCDVEIVQDVTQRGSRPATTVKDIDFFDNINSGKTLSIIGDVSDIKFFNNKIKGSLTADATARGRITLSEVDFETGSVLTIPSGSLYLLDVISSPATVNLTGSTLVVDRRF